MSLTIYNYPQLPINGLLNNNRQFYEELYKTPINAYMSNNESDEKKSYTDMCSAKVFQLLPHQLFLKHYLSPNTPYYNLLIFHSTGLGKTCAAISIAEAHINLKQGVGNKRINIILPRSIISGFKTELHNILGNTTAPEKAMIVGERQCTGLRYKNYNLEDNPNIKARQVNAFIDSLYNIITFDKFVNLVENLSDNDIKTEYNHSIFIVDEYHNIKNYGDLDNEEKNDINVPDEDNQNTLNKLNRYNTLMRVIKNTDRVKLVLLSATPMFDTVDDIKSIVDLFRANLKLPPINYSLAKYDNLFTTTPLTDKDIAFLETNLIGAVSYHTNKTSLKMIQPNFNVEVCKMSPEHKKWYIEKITNNKNAFDARRITSYMTRAYNEIEGLEPQYSQKYHKLIHNISQQINKSNSGLIFIYTEFIKTIEIIQKLLTAHLSIKPYSKNQTRNACAVIRGNTSMADREHILEVFNSRDNVNGRKIKILIGTQVLKEGVSLKNVEFIHILEPWFNMSRITQIAGRGVRLCSHIELYSARRDQQDPLQAVDIKLYISTYQQHLNKQKINLDDYTDIEHVTYDEYIYHRAIHKQTLIDAVVDQLIKISIDCPLNSKTDDQCMVKKPSNIHKLPLERFIIEPIIAELKTMIREYIVDHTLINHAILTNLGMASKSYEALNASNKFRMLKYAAAFALRDLDMNPQTHNKTTYQSLYHRSAQGAVAGFIRRQMDGNYIFIRWNTKVVPENIDTTFELNKGFYKPIVLQQHIDDQKHASAPPDNAPDAVTGVVGEQPTSIKFLTTKRITGQEDLIAFKQLGTFFIYLIKDGRIKIGTDTSKSKSVLGTLTFKDDILYQILDNSPFDIRTDKPSYSEPRIVLIEYIKRILFPEHIIEEFIHRDNPRIILVKRLNIWQFKTYKNNNIVYTPITSLTITEIKQILALLKMTGENISISAKLWKQNTQAVIDHIIIPSFVNQLDINQLVANYDNLGQQNQTTMHKIFNVRDTQIKLEYNELNITTPTNLYPKHLIEEICNCPQHKTIKDMFKFIHTQIMNKKL